MQLLRSPYLALIALFVFLLTWISTFLYLEQQALVELSDLVVDGVDGVMQLLKQIVADVPLADGPER